MVLSIAAIVQIFRRQVYSIVELYFKNLADQCRQLIVVSFCNIQNSGGNNQQDARMAAKNSIIILHRTGDEVCKSNGLYDTRGTRTGTILTQT